MDFLFMNYSKQQTDCNFSVLFYLNKQLAFHLSSNSCTLTRSHLSRVNCLFLNLTIQHKLIVVVFSVTESIIIIDEQIFIKSHERL